MDTLIEWLKVVKPDSFCQHLSYIITSVINAHSYWNHISWNDVIGASYMYHDWLAALQGSTVMLARLQPLPEIGNQFYALGWHQLQPEVINS